MKDACYVMQQQLVFNMIFIHKVNAGPHYAITALTGVDNPQLNIHSIREPGGMDDIKHSTGLLRIGF
ncbi:hypothetical protein RO3G_06662 [Rhizopus delemar RA 99-880]|uniref:Uncharacterized protein n=1 Tax=Rhizopus delemar (strain RA 99-880 / ATCC MYA-4621 / FGSC 9543 / NRRL 43880) TaxID=246409 RepID=I1C0H7_RHIO9|nr:hypothetical protein RO3G_06662 [Rhizopus delemar RA 99-880]|eukprot:EIE81957.1 hypothetical protein RO3G_06662 [Rhizopus delemar RA 99-880]